MNGIAVVGMACRYPDAASPEQLWENVLAGRRAFRRLPDERMRLADYWSPDPAAPDRFYARTAAVIEGYEFDRVGFRVPGSTYRSTDLTHWLALDVAARAIADAGFPDGDELPRERTGVVMGNSLTGEFTRANLMRLRWPYVRRTLAAALREEGWDGERLARFLAGVERRYKEPFPAVDEDTLAGGLSNTIAGRICNHFDLKGGGYTVDGACSSSLLSVATACRSLLDNELDVAIAGGVDLSIDPFEIVGFAKTGALATGEMRVYDRRSSGFWPGEGCGMVVLMREADARAAGRRSYAMIAGYGVSSDGKGGITRPEPAGYRLALRRAYRQAGFGIETVGLFEGHGTGTPVGNDTELTALSLARRAADPAAPPAAIGSIKAMIGHTKAAAGIAGLLKAVLAVHHEVLPPTVGCHDPHPVFEEEPPALRVLPGAEPWPLSASIRAGVSAMGFGGINTHVVVENPQPRRREALAAPVVALSRLAAGDGAELLVLDADDPGELRSRVEPLAGFVGRLSYAEVGDLAVTLQRAVRGRPYRAAVVAHSPEQAQERLRSLYDALEQPPAGLQEPAEGVFVGRAGDVRVGFLFPGQGSGKQTVGGALRRRFAPADDAFTQAALPTDVDAIATAVAQPRIVVGSVAGLRVLSALGISATVAVGHSLGELTALHWAGSLDEAALLRIAEVRGRVMADRGRPGTMASLAAPPDRVEPLLAGTPVVIAGYNGPRQTVVAGPVAAVKQVTMRAGEAGIGSMLLPVSHAFHSPLVAPAAGEFGAYLAGEAFTAPERPVISTITGAPLEPGANLKALLRRQITEPVRYASALAAAAERADLFIEVGPGSILSRLAAANTKLPAVSIDTDSPSLAPLWSAIGAAFAAGVPVRFDTLLADRPDRGLVVGAELRFFANPCEAAPEEAPGVTVPEAAAVVVDAEPGTVPAGPIQGTVERLRELVATRAELPAEAVRDDSRLLDDLHLSSITVGQVLGQAARELGLPASQTPTSFATATLRELASALDELRETGDGAGQADQVAGVGPWVRPFRTELVAAPEPAPAGTEPDGPWRVYAWDGHPLAEPLRRALAAGGVGGGVLVCLPPDCRESDLELALLGARAAVDQPPGGRLVVIQHGRGASAIAKTARLEGTRLRTTVIDTPMEPGATARIVADVAATTGFRDIRYDQDGHRWTPVLRPYAPLPGTPPLAGSDVLLVTGGGKGITAECALALARDSGARLAVLGRSDPDTDEELSANLARMAEAGATVHYARADVTDAAAVRAAVAELTAALGPVTAVLHGAGRNEPAGLASLDMPAFRAAIAPKLDGLAAVLDALDPAALRLLVTFGSIIGRAGLRGEAHYATANDWLAEDTVALAGRYPRCRAICLEWSVWSGVGMGERLSVVESLMREGITPITTERGVEVLRQLLADPDPPPVVVVTGRAEGVDTISYERPPLPLLRFVEKPLVHYPGVELVAEAVLTPDADPYLADHLLDGNLLFPAVLGMEAMAQIAVALRGGSRPDPPQIEQAEFARPIVVPPGGETTIRIAALATGPEQVEVAIRSGETGFGADHFRATLRFARTPVRDGEPAPAAVAPPVLLDPARDLYGDLLFQSGRFRRLLRYRRAAARHAEADVAVRAERWFGAFLPGELVLGDPGARDAYMHGLQVCVPHATLLPAAIERLQTDGRAPVPELAFTAAERSRDGDTYVYDIAVRAPDGTVVERWDGLRLRAVRKSDGDRSWPPALLGPFLQRRLDDLLGVPLAVSVEPGLDSDRRGHTAIAVGRALGRAIEPRYRPDGRPELPDGGQVTAAHGAGVTLAVVGRSPVGCDVEPVVPRTAEAWADLLGSHETLVALIDNGSWDTAATRVWCALESVQKAGEQRDAPLTVSEDTAAGWTLFRSGEVRVATFATALTGVPEQVVLAVAVRGGP
jgi:enediyne polyketide synthase